MIGITQIVSKKICLNPTDGRYAVMVTIEDGTMSFEGVRNDPKKNLDKKELEWDGRAMMSTKNFLKLLKREMSVEKLILKVLSRKVKVRGVKNVLFLLKVFRLGRDEKEE